jgi:hypothetical protein
MGGRLEKGGFDVAAAEELGRTATDRICDKDQDDPIYLLIAVMGEHFAPTGDRASDETDKQTEVGPLRYRSRLLPTYTEPFKKCNGRK